MSAPITTKLNIVVAFFLNVLVLAVARPSVCPTIVSRAEWGARPPKADPEPMTKSPTPYIVVHHGGIKQYCFDQESCSKIVASYQRYHMDDHGWDDIGYSFVVGEDGLAYEGRGWDARGAHAPGYNQQSIGICVIGDFTDRMPNEAAVATVQALVDCGVALGKVQPTYGMIGHRQGSATECPGTTFYQWVTTNKHWTDDPTPMTIV